MSYPCQFCPRHFGSQQAINAHQQVHKRERAVRAVKKASPLNAKARLRGRKVGGHLRASVPCLVMDALGGRDGDQIIFERGNLTALENAPLRGTYFIVYLLKAKEQADVQPEVEAAQPQATATPPESFIEGVRKKIEEHGQVRT